MTEIAQRTSIEPAIAVAANRVLPMNQRHVIDPIDDKLAAEYLELDSALKEFHDTHLLSGNL